MNIEIDERGKTCPIPVIETKKAIEKAGEPSVVLVHVDNETAVENLKRLSMQVGKLIEAKKIDDKHYTVKLETTIATETCEPVVYEDCTSATGNTVVVFEGDYMGKGSAELGKILIKGFIYALRELPELPKTCLFYNEGAKLTNKESESLEDLQALEEAGVEILTCGTCADFFNIKEDIAVGSITNMYTIVETMANAGKIIKP